MNWFVKLLLLVALPAFLAMLFARLSVDRSMYLSMAVGEAVGAALVPFGIAAIWNWISARAAKGKLAPGEKAGVSPGAVCCAWLLTVVSCYGLLKSNDWVDVPQPVAQSYQGPGCDLAVTFPGVPTMKPVTLPATATGMSGEQAELLTADSYMRLECVQYPTSIVFTLDQVERQLKNYIAQQGFHDVGYDSVNEVKDISVKGIVVGARGNKEIAGAGLTTYETTMIFRPGSMVALITASNAKIYPTASVKAFRASLHEVP